MVPEITGAAASIQVAEKEARTARSSVLILVARLAKRSVRRLVTVVVGAASRPLDCGMVSCFISRLMLSPANSDRTIGSIGGRIGGIWGQLKVFFPTGRAPALAPGLALPEVSVQPQK